MINELIEESIKEEVVENMLNNFSEDELNLMFEKLLKVMTERGIIGAIELDYYDEDYED